MSTAVIIRNIIEQDYCALDKSPKPHLNHPPPLGKRAKQRNTTLIGGGVYLPFSDLEPGLSHVNGRWGWVVVRPMVLHVHYIQAAHSHGTSLADVITSVRGHTHMSDDVSYRVTCPLPFLPSTRSQYQLRTATRAPSMECTLKNVQHKVHPTGSAQHIKTVIPMNPYPYLRTPHSRPGKRPYSKSVLFFNRCWSSLSAPEPK